MKLFSRLFTPAPPPPPPPPALEQQVTALETAPADVVMATAMGGVGNTTPALRHAAQERAARLIDTGSIDFDAFCSAREHWPESVTVVALCKDPDRLRQLLARVDDPVVLAGLVTEGATTRVRQAAATAIDDPAQLRKLLPRVRGKDKNVYRIIKHKCDALAAEQRKADDFALEVTTLCESLERHSEKPHDPRYAATLEALTARWRALALRSDPGLEQRVELALGRCREVIAAHERDVARQATERAAAQAAEREAREARERSLEADRRAAVERAEAEARALAEAAAAREAEERARTERQAAVAQAHREIASLIRLSSAALARGDTRKAARFRFSVEEFLQTAPAVPPYLTRNLQQLDERLNELRQWKDYVVAPKRIELIEEMEALVGSDEEPQALAEHIRALQQEWRTINKGIASDASAEGERFQKAHQAAFKPCQEYFAAQAAVRRANLDARKQVLERLKAFEASQDAERLDYGLIAQVLREAPREWRSHSPIDRESSRSTEVEFHQAMGRLRTILDAWYERNEADKQAVITQARHLSTAEDTSEAIEGVKRLQVQWKDTGPASREKSQALWDEFRGLCDAVFKRRAEAYAAHSAGLESAKAQAVALCEQVEQASSAPAMDRPSAGAKVRDWHAAFDALGELPRADARNLRGRFERAISRYESGLAEQGRRDAEAAESNLFEAGRLIRAYECAVTKQAPPEERESLKNAAEAFIAGVRRWPDGGPQALKQALARAESAPGPDDAGRELALRMLCIRCEIASSTPTPPEDEELRRDYQLRMLMERMGQGRSLDDRDQGAMLLEWIGIGAVAPEVHDHLERRFRQARAKRPTTRS